MPHGRPDLALRLEPAAAADRARARGPQVTDLVVLTDGEEFLAALREAVSSNQRVWRVPTTDQAAELLAAGRVGVLVLDTDCVPHGAPQLITQLNLEFPDLVVVVAGTHDEVSQFTHLVSEGLVYRFLQKPVSPARVRAFIDAAVRRHVELVAEAPATVVARKHRRRSWPRWLGLTVIALAIVGALLYKQWQQAVPTPVPAASSQESFDSPAVEPTREVEDTQAIAAAEAERLAKEREQRRLAQIQADAQAAAKRAEFARDQAAIDRAAAAHAANTQPALRQPAAREPAPREPVAREPNVSLPVVKLRPDPIPQPPVTESVPAIAPTPSPAKQVSQLLGDAQAAIAAGNLVEPESGSAKSLIAAALKLDPQNPAARQALTQLQGQVVARAQAAVAKPDPAAAVRWIGEARELGVAETELAAIRRAQVDAERRLRTDRLSGIARLAAQRIADDQLIEPAGDNARQYLKQLQLEDPALAQPLWQQFAARLLGKARREQSQGDFDAAARWLNEAQETGQVATDVAAARTELEAARAQAAFVAKVVPSAQLRNTKYVPPTYPPRAIDQGIGGWVDLEFTVDATGSVRDVAVKRAVPTGYFEKAAVDAVSRWRYQPVLRDGKAVEQRATVRVQFKMVR